jgi:hypothetical protein
VDFYVVLGPSTEIIGTETIAENKENILYKWTVRSFVKVLPRGFLALSIIA